MIVGTPGYAGLAKRTGARSFRQLRGLVTGDVRPAGRSYHPKGGSVNSMFAPLREKTGQTGLEIHNSLHCKVLRISRAESIVTKRVAHGEGNRLVAATTAIYWPLRQHPAPDRPRPSVRELAIFDRKSSMAVAAESYGMTIRREFGS